MGTRALIGRDTGNTHWQARYVHNNGNPARLGATLYYLYSDFFQRDLHRMLHFLLEEHTGWSNLVRADFTLAPAWHGACGFDPDAERVQPVCYCHGDRHEDRGWYTDVQTDGTDCAWLYVFSETALSIYQHAGFKKPRHTDKWQLVDTLNLHEGVPDWEAIELRAKMLERINTHLAQPPEGTPTLLHHRTYE